MGRRPIRTSSRYAAIPVLRRILTLLLVSVAITGCGGSKPARTTGLSVPVVVGLDAASACERITKAGLHCGTASAVVKCSTQPRNEVLAVSPKTGRSVAPKSAVVLTLSGGACSARVPKVVGLSADAASQLLGDLHYTVVYGCTVDPSHNGRVDKQSPSADKPAAPGSSVTITVALPHCAAGNNS